MGTIFNAKSSENYKNLVKTAKGAKIEVREAKSVFYFIRQLNALAKKNEFINGVNVRELGKKCREYAILHGYELKAGILFSAYLFQSVNGVVCYKQHKAHKAGGAFAVNVDVITWQPVKLSENGVIDACKHVLGIEAKAADKIAKAAEREARKAERSAKAAERKALKKQQAEAIKAFQRGEMPLDIFEEIMKRAA